MNIFLRFSVLTLEEREAPIIDPAAAKAAIVRLNFQSIPLVIPLPMNPINAEKSTIMELVAKAILRGIFPTIINNGTIKPPPDIPTIPATNPIAKTDGITIKSGIEYSYSQHFLFHVGPIFKFKFFFGLDIKKADNKSNAENIDFK